MSGSSRDPLVVGGVIGDVLDPFQSSIPIRVSYNGKELNNGCEFKPSQVVNQPRVSVGGDDLRNFYTLVTEIMSHNWICCIYINKQKNNWISNRNHRKTNYNYNSFVIINVEINVLFLCHWFFVLFTYSSKYIQQQKSWIDIIKPISNSCH